MLPLLTLEGTACKVDNNIIMSIYGLKPHSSKESIKFDMDSKEN